MLTLSQPIQLNSSRPFLSLSDGFQERITGNYELLRAHFTPKDLLFLLTAPPELPEDLGGMTTIAVDNTAVDARRITLEVVNHVLNRILISDQPSFTYQDQVYITSVLNKLGITDVQQFMEQVRQVRQENHSVRSLLQLYQQEEARLRQVQAAGETPAGRQAQAPSAAPERAQGRDQRYYLHDAIYQRLETGAIYQSFNAYQSSVSALSPHNLTNALQLSEQLRVSQLLSLNQLRQQSIYGAPLTMLQRVNHYELGDLLPPPRDEEQVLSQAAEAALLSTVEHVITQAMGQGKADGMVWLSLEQALSQSVDNTLSRFESYHSADGPSYHSSTNYEPLLRELYREEASVLEHFHHEAARLEAQAARPAPQAPGQPGGPTRLEYLQSEQIVAETIQRLQEVSGRSPAVPTPELPAGREEAALGEHHRDQGQSPPSPQAVHPPSQPEPSPLEYLQSEQIVAETIQRLQEVTGLSPTVRSAPEPAADRENAAQGKHHRDQERPSPLSPTHAGQPLSQPGPARLEYLQLEQSTQETVRSLRELTGLQRELVLLEQTPGTEGVRPTGSPPYRAEEKTPAVTAAQAAAQVVRQERERILEAVQAARPAPPDTQEQPAPTQLEHRQPEQSDQETVHSLRELTDLQRELMLLEQAPGAEGVRPPVPPPYQAEEGSPAITAAQAAAQVVRQERERILEAVQTAHPTPPDTPEQPIPTAAPQLEGVPEPVRRLLLQPPPSQEEREALLAQELRQIDQRNREIHQRLLEVQAAQQKGEQPPPSPPDRSKLMADALRSMDAPEQVIRELLEQPTAQKAKAPQPPQQLDLMLNQADAATRSLYESILLYESDPASARDRGIVPASLGGLNSEAARQRREGAQLLEQLEHTRRESAVERERTETVLEHIRQDAAQEERAPQAPTPQRSPLHFVHRQQEDQFTDELLERLEQRQTTAVRQEVSTQTVTRQIQEQIQNVDINQTLVTQTSEDITALINRTLAKQMNLISDKVYHQMEKRLQTERYRRGRF